MAGKRKGQTSFEMMIIVTLVTVMVLSGLRLVPQIVTSTEMIAVLKGETLEALSEESEFYYIADISEPNTRVSPQQITIFIGGGTLTPQLIQRIEGLDQNLADANVLSDPARLDILVRQA